MKNLLPVVLLLLAGTLGCALTLEPAVRTPVDHDLAHALRAVPPSARVDTAAVRLQAFLWRSFDREAPDGKPLVVLARLTTPAGTAPASGYVATLLSLVRGSDAVWQTVPSADPDEWWAGREGPRWEPGETVDVVLDYRTMDGRTGQVRVSGVPIQRTD